MNRQDRMRLLNRETKTLIEKHVRQATSREEAFDVAASVLATAASYTGTIDTAIALLIELKARAA